MPAPTLAEIRTMNPNEKVTLVATDIITPYKKGEIFTVTAEQAQKLLTVDNTPTDFGVRNAEVKCRPFDPDKDAQLLLDNRVLNQVEQAKLEKKLNTKE